MAKRPPVKRPRKKSKREDILKAGMNVFCHFGYDGATLDKIADKAGVSKALIVRFYENKKNLLFVCINRFLEEFDGELEKNAKREGNTYREHCDFLFRYFKKIRSEFRLLISIMSTPALGEMVKEIIPSHLGLTEGLFGYFSVDLGEEQKKALNYDMYSLLVAYVIGGNEENYLRARDQILDFYLESKK